jgi:aspartate kinase
MNPGLPGTIIHKSRMKGLPPIIVIKKNQVLLELKSKDFSFVEEKPIAELFHLFEKLKVKPNLTQNAAISIICVLDDHDEKIEKLALEASSIFDVQMMKGLTLLSIRHYKQQIFEKLTKEKTILLRQQTPETIQVLIRELSEN